MKPVITTLRTLIASPVLVLAISAGAAHADEVYASSFPGGIVTGTVNAELIVDVHCTIAQGAFVNGNVKQEDPRANWNITVTSGATINGNIDEYGGGSVLMAVGSGQLFDGSIKEEGEGHVLVAVLDGGLYNGNITERDGGWVVISVSTSGLFNGNAYEEHAGNLITFGDGMYNGSTQEEGPGICRNAIRNFNGSPCE